jgi:chitinase
MQGRQWFLNAVVWLAVAHGSCVNPGKSAGTKPVIATQDGAVADAADAAADGGEGGEAGGAADAARAAAVGGGGGEARGSAGVSAGGFAATDLEAAGTQSDTKPPFTGNVAAKGPWVSGYYVGSQMRLYAPDKIDWNGLTHLLVGPVVPKIDGGLITTYDIDATNGPVVAKRLIDLAHEHGKKAIAMLGGSSQHANWVAATSDANRANFVQNLLGLMQTFGYDGFDLDWDPIEVNDQGPLRALAEELRANAPEMVLLLPVRWVDAYAGKAPTFYAEIARLFDQINIMTYGMSDSWSGWQSWHSSALHGHTPQTRSSIESSVDAYLGAGVPAAKLGIGVGFFGLCWILPVTGPRQRTGGSAVVAADNDMSYTNIMASYYGEIAHAWDDEASAPYLSFQNEHGPRGCSYVSYDDAQSIQAKADYVKQRGLGGAIVWTINQGYLPNAAVGQRDPLMQAMSAFLK